MKAMTGTQLFGTAAGAGAVGGALGAVAAAFVTGMFSFLPNITNVDPKVTEAAIAVLQAEPEPTAAPLRQWAMTVIDKRATFSFTDEGASDDEVAEAASTARAGQTRWLINEIEGMLSNPRTEEAMKRQFLGVVLMFALSSSAAIADETQLLGLGGFSRSFAR
jgi:hypothetical protein